MDEVDIVEESSSNLVVESEERKCPDVEILVGTYEEYVIGYRLGKEEGGKTKLEQTFTARSHCGPVRYSISTFCHQKLSIPAYCFECREGQISGKLNKNSCLDWYVLHDKAVHIGFVTLYIFSSLKYLNNIKKF